jgi:hypothetical protein
VPLVYDVMCTIETIPEGNKQNVVCIEDHCTLLSTLYEAQARSENLTAHLTSGGVEVTHGNRLLDDELEHKNSTLMAVDFYESEGCCNLVLRTSVHAPCSPCTFVYVLSVHPPGELVSINAYCVVAEQSAPGV